MSQADTPPHLRGHQPHLRNATVLRDAIGFLDDVDDLLNEQEIQDTREREEIELAARRWLANEVSMDD